MNRIPDHPILGKGEPSSFVTIIVDGKPLKAREGQMIAAALMENGYEKFRTTSRLGEPRFFYCGIGQCTDCMMEVDGVPGIRTCITPVREGMTVNTLRGLGTWRKTDEKD